MTPRLLLLCILFGLLLPAPVLSQVQGTTDSLLHIADTALSVAPDSLATDSNRIISADSPAAQPSDTTRPDSVIATDSLVTDTGRIVPADSLATDTIRQDTTAAGTSFYIRGAIKDKNTGEGVPFATIFIPGTGIGTPADLDGNFELRFSNPPNDTLRVQAMGYTTFNRMLDYTRPEVVYTFELDRAATMMNEVVVHAGEDPALMLLKKIIRNKPKNDPDRLVNYRYEVYNKLEVDIERLSRKQFEKLPLLKPFGFIYDNLDTVSEAKPFLPFYLTETLSDYYFQKEPKKTKEFIKANQLKGISNESITQFLGSMYQNVNAYANFIPVFDKSFVSPISSSGAFYYRYKLKDTQEAYGHRIILVQFAPRRAGENCFFGDFWVADSSYALQRISMEVPKEANINWVSRVSLYQEFAPVEDTLWFCIKDKFIADFSLPYSSRLPGFIGRKTTSYKDIVVNDSSIAAIVTSSRFKQDVVIDDSARLRGNDFWTTARHDTLSKNEKAIYKMVDTLTNMPVFVRTKNTIKFLATGIKEIGPIEIGPIWNLYSSNPVEGRRIRLSLGTTPKLFKDVYLNGYVAYGTQDKEWKYKASALWLLERHPRSYLYVSQTHDVDRSNNYYDEPSNTDNLFSGSFRKKYLPWKLAFLDETRVEYFKEYFSGFSHKLILQHREFDPYDPLPSAGIFRDENGEVADEVVNTEVGLNLRFAYKERFLEGNYYRYTMGSKYPIVELRLGLGIKNVWNSGYSYQKANISISDWVKVPPLGLIYYNVFAGKYFGTLPYPLLEVHPGNDFYFYNNRAFNMMNRYEFISDEYAGFMFEHTIGGGVFNYIPLLKKAKLRQFWTARGIIGKLNADNRALNLDKGYEFRTLQGSPYLELGTGVENIFQLFRVDFVWRVTPQPLPGESQEKYFGIFGSVKFAF